MDEPIGRHLGAYALCVRSDPTDRILLVRIRHEIDDGKWTLPGGGVEPGEHPDHAVLRELHEETGLSGVAMRIAGVHSFHYRRTPARARPPVHHVGIIYAVDRLTGDLLDEADGTTDRAAWIDRDELGSIELVPLAVTGIGLAWP